MGKGALAGRGAPEGACKDTKIREYVCSDSKREKDQLERQQQYVLSRQTPTGGGLGGDHEDDGDDDSGDLTDGDEDQD